MTPRQFVAYRNGVTERQRQAAELARAVAYLVSGPNLKKGTTMRKFWPLPWDVAPKFEPQTREERAAFEEQARAIFRKQKELKAQAQNGNNI